MCDGGGGHECVIVMVKSVSVAYRKCVLGGGGGGE